jgi:hypothetical protein
MIFEKLLSAPRNPKEARMRASTGSFRIARSLALVSALVLVMAACKKEETPATGPATVDIGLTEWAVSVSPTSAEAGKITFEARNTGAEKHEFVIIKTDLALTALPTKQDGSLDEEGQGIEIIDEIEEFEAGAPMTLDADLAAGNYVFVCNVVEVQEDGTIESHYRNGMRNLFKAT